MNSGEQTDSPGVVGQGMPIFLDPIKAGTLYDLNATTHDPVRREWVPFNSPAKRLWRAMAALGDVTDGVEHYNLARDPKKKRRRLRLLAVPMHSLCVSIIDTLNALISDQQIHSRLPPDCTKQLNEMKEKFVSFVPFDRKRKLGQMRNKTAAHLDESTHPFELSEIVKNVQPTEMGEWLHYCIGTLCDVLKLDAYIWTAVTGSADLLVFMCQDRFVSVLRCESGRAVELLNVYLSDTSPKQEILENLMDACEASQPLFEEKSIFRITGFYQDDPKKGWASMLRNPD